MQDTGLISQSYTPPSSFSKRQMLNAPGHPNAKAQRNACITWNKQKHNGYYKGDYPPRDHDFRIMQNRRRSILKSSHNRHLNEAATRNTVSPNDLKCPQQSSIGNCPAVPPAWPAMGGCILSVCTVIYEVSHLPKNNESSLIIVPSACLLLALCVSGGQHCFPRGVSQVVPGHGCLP